MKKNTFLKTGIVAVALVLTSLNTLGQTPVNGGFEDGSTSWGFASSATVSMVHSSDVSNARTGTGCIAVTQTGTDGTTSRAITSSINLYPTIGQSLHILYWAKNTKPGIGNVGGGLSPTGTPASLSNGSSTATNGAGTTYTRFVSNKTNITADATVKPTVRTYVLSTATDFPNILYVDDYIIYIDNILLPDLLKPGSATSVVAIPTSTTISWKNGADITDTATVTVATSSNTGIQGTIVLRTTTLDAKAPELNDQAVYSVAGGSTGPNMIDAWTVISTDVASSATSFQDATRVAGTFYKYAVVHRDMAYNYSVAALSTSGTNTGVNSIKASINCVGTNNAVKFFALTQGNVLNIYNLAGSKVYSQTVKASELTVNVAKGVYIVRIADAVAKVIVK